MANLAGLMRGTGLLRAAEANSICRIQCLFGGSVGGVWKFGSGFLVRRKFGKCYVATAGHVLCDPAHGFPSQIELILGSNSGGSRSFPYTFVDNVADRCFVPQNFASSGAEDFGLIRIDDANGVLDGLYCFDLSSVLPVQNLVRLEQSTVNLIHTRLL